ncbi:hypothetical protein [Caulobacter sp. S45]|uniref:hypothetical protein n=1 Tax=Caulobacter sp. S45 TaxID=1641861 RepID=UPI001576C5E8|nr:hypothetical protein [Caulobacter sp. S45]
MSLNARHHPHFVAGASTAVDPAVAFTIVVSSGVTSSGLTLDSTQYEDVLSGGLAVSNTIDSGGLVTVESGGRTGGDVVLSGGAEVASSGGLLESVIVSSGGLLSGPGNLLGGEIEGNAAGLRLARVDDESSNVTVTSGGLVSAFTINALANLSVESGGEAFATSAAGGDLTVEYGGDVSGTSVTRAGGTLFVQGTAENTRVVSGGLVYAEGTSSGSSLVSGVQVAVGGTLEVASGGSVSAARVSAGGQAQLDNGGALAGAAIVGGGLKVGFGGDVLAASISSGGTMEVGNNGAASATQVTSGVFTVDAGGEAIGINVAAGGSLVLNGLAGGGTAFGQTQQVFDGQLTGSGLFEQAGGVLTVEGTTSGFTGLMLVFEGAIEVATSQGLGLGGVLFGGQDSQQAATLLIDAVDRPVSGATYGTTLSNFQDPLDRLDLAGLAFVSGATAKSVGGVLTLTDGAYKASFKLAETEATKYAVGSDGKGGTLIRAATGAGTRSLVQAAAAFPASFQGLAHTSASEPHSARIEMVAEGVNRSHALA